MRNNRAFFLCVFFGLALAIPFLGRVVLLTTRHADLAGISVVQLMVIGTRLDVIIAGGAAFVVALAALLLPSGRWAEAMLVWLGTLELAFLTLAELAGWFFFSYFDFRPNYLVLEHVADPEVVKTLAAGYPWVRVVLALLMSATISHRLLTRMRRGSRPERPRDRLETAGVILLMGLCVRGAFDHRPLNPSFASFSSNRLANEIAGNGVLNVIHELAMRGDEQYTRVQDVAGRMSVPDAFSFARARLESSGAFIENADNPLLRHVAGGPRHDFNVVVVVMEGFTARLAGAWGIFMLIGRWATFLMRRQPAIISATRFFFSWATTESISGGTRWFP